MTFDDGDRDDDGGGRRKPQKPRKPREYKPREPRPLDAAQFQELALGYAARYATTAAKLRRYLARKLQERQWTPADPPDIEGLIARITGLGYVDDRAYATLKARELGARGFGQRRVRATLSAAGVSRDDSAAALDPDDEETAESPYVAAIAFARRRRFGPFARDGGRADLVRQRRELAAMARAGHDFEIARRVVAAPDEAAAEALLDRE
jgi:regulatory protein